MKDRSHPWHVLMVPSFYSDPEHPQGGNFIRDQALALRSAAVRVGLVVLEARRLRYLQPAALAASRFQTSWADEDGLDVLRCHGWNPLLNHRPGGWITTRLLAAMVDRYVARRGCPDLIHAHNALYAGLAAGRAARRHGRPVVITEHNPFCYREDLLRRAYSMAACVMPVSKHLAARIEPYVADRERLVVVPNSVDLDRFTLRSPGTATKGWRYLAAGNYYPVKEFDRLIDAFAVVAASMPDAELRIAGDGPEEHVLRDRIAAHGLGDRVCLLGRLSPDALRDEMHAAGAFVVSSRSESFSVVIIEALATGVPVVATRCGGPQTILDDATGVLVEPCDTAALAAGLYRVRERTWDGRQLRAHVAARYGRDIVVPQLLTIYARACAEGQAAR